MDRERAPKELLVPGQELHRVQVGRRDEGKVEEKLFVRDAPGLLRSGRYMLGGCLYVLKRQR